MDEDINLLDIVSPLVAKWKLLLVATLIGGIIGLALSSSIRKTYESSASIYIQSSSGMSGLLGSLPVGLGAGKGGNDAYLMTLLDSRSLRSGVISRLKLTSHPHFAGKRPISMENALRRLEHSATAKEDKNNCVRVTVRSASPYLAAKIANSMLDGLGSLVVTSSKRKVEFISERLDETAADLKKAEDEMQEFMERHDIASIDEQTKSTVAALSDLDGKLLAVDVDLQAAKSQLANSGQLDQLVDQEVRQKAMESSRDYIIGKQQELHAKLSQLPATATTYLRIQRKLGILNKTFELLNEQYQSTRVTQQGEDGDYQIVDRAVPEMKPVSPRVGLTSALAGFLSFLIASCLVYVCRPTPKTKVTVRMTRGWAATRKQ